MFVEPSINWSELKNTNKMASVNERGFSKKLSSGLICITKYSRSLFSTLLIQTAQLALRNLAADLNLIIFIIYEPILFIAWFFTHISRYRNFYEEH